MLRKAVLSIAAVVLLLSFTSLYAADKVECPVCGFMVDAKEALRHEHEGTMYYFCNAGCKAYFLKNSEAITSGQAYDAVCGMTFDKDKGIRAEHGGRAVYFCAAECKDKYFDDPAKYEINYDVVADQIVPVREMKHKVEYEGMTYYFTSDESRDKFKAEPAAYIYEACPIGGDVFLRKDAAGSREYKGKTYYFGCKGCVAKFDEDADKYMSQKGALECQKSCKSESSHGGCPLKKKSSM